MSFQNRNIEVPQAVIRWTKLKFSDGNGDAYIHPNAWDAVVIEDPAEPRVAIYAAPFEDRPTSGGRRRQRPVARATGEQAQDIINYLEDRWQLSVPCDRV